MSARLIYPNRYLPSYAMTGTVNASTNVNIERQGLFYKNVSGASAEIGLTLTRDPIFGDPTYWIICSPQGDGMIGTIDVRFYRPAPPTYGSYTSYPRYTPEGLPDRRIVKTLNAPAPDASNQITIRIRCAAESEISRIIPIFGNETNGPDMTDITDQLQSGWKIAVEEHGKNGSSYGDYIWDVNQQENPIRYRRFAGTLNYLSLDVFRKRGLHREVMIVPRWFEHTDDPEKLRLMYSTAVFGRFAKNYEARLVGVETSEFGPNPIYNYPIEIKELI